MAINLPGLRVLQPQQPAQVDRSNSLADKIEFLHTPASLRDLTGNGYNLEKHANVNILPHNGETGWITTATTGEDVTFLKGLSIASGEDFSMLVRLKVLPQGAEDTTGGAMVLRSSASATPIIGIYVGANGVTTSANRVLYLCRDDSGSLSNAGTAGPLINDGKTHTLGLKRHGTSWYWSVDGSAWSSFAGASLGAITLSGPSAMNYGNDTRNGAIGNLNAAFSLGVLWRRGISDFEIKRLHENPWQLFQRTARKLYFDVASSGVTVTPSASIARALGIAPTIQLGSMSVTTAVVTARAAAVAPTTLLGSLVIAPAAAAARALAQVGNTVLGSLSIIPAVAAAKAAAVVGSVAGGAGLVVSAAAAVARAIATAPSVLLGSLSVSPATASARALARIGSILDGGAALVSDWLQRARRRGRR